MQPVAHAGHDERDELEWWRVVVWPGVVSDAVVDHVIRVSGAFGAEFPDCPVLAVVFVQEGDELV